LQFCKHASQLVQRVNERGKRTGNDYWFSDRKLLGECEDPREVDACVMRVGGWWSIQYNAVLFP
jgi:hypothetical protein